MGTYYIQALDYFTEFKPFNTLSRYFCPYFAEEKIGSKIQCLGTHSQLVVEPVVKARLVCLASSASW